MRQQSPRLESKDFRSLPTPLQHELRRLQEGGRSLPSFLSMLANAPVILEAYIAFSDAIQRSSLSPTLRNKISLAVSELNSSPYDLASSIQESSTLRINPEEVHNCRLGRSDVPQHDAILTFATTLVRKHGHLGEDELDRLRQYLEDDRDIVEVIAAVACTHFSNLLNNLAQTPIDHPAPHEIRHQNG